MAREGFIEGFNKGFIEGLIEGSIECFNEGQLAEAAMKVPMRV